MRTLKIQLLHFPGCPNVEAARAALSEALSVLSLTGAACEEVNVNDPATPAHLRNYPSPTILVEGLDIEGCTPTDAAACRIYDGKGGGPQKELIIKALAEFMSAPGKLN